MSEVNPCDVLCLADSDIRDKRYSLSRCQYVYMHLGICVCATTGVIFVFSKVGN